MLDYLENKIDKSAFVKNCKEIYERSMEFATYNLTLELHILIPFIHEFAYCRYEDRELREQVLFLERLLNGEEEYHSSSFLKLPSPNHSDKDMYDLYCNFEKIELCDIYQLFEEKIENPKTFRELLYNSICNLLLDVNMSDIEESDLDYINCCEEISCQMIKEKILIFLSYYLGIKAFYISVNFCKEKKKVYMIS